MKHTTIIAMYIFTLILTASVFAQRDYSKVEIKTTHIAGNIYMLEGSGGNIGVSVGEDGVFMIDDQFAPLADKIRDAIKKLGGEKPKFILNTHWHGDHVGGNVEFGKDGTIIAHTNVRQRLTTRQKLFGDDVDARPKVAWPVITFDESLSIHFNGEEVRVLHLPHGHTDGDSVVFFTKSNVVHMGDLMFAGMFPFVDLDHGGNVLGLTRNVAKVIARVKPDVTVIPGHGPVSTLRDLKNYHRMLVETTDVVKSGIAAGKNLKEIQAAGVPEKWKSWGTGFIKTDRWLETIFSSLKDN